MGASEARTLLVKLLSAKTDAEDATNWRRVMEEGRCSECISVSFESGTGVRLWMRQLRHEVNLGIVNFSSPLTAVVYTKWSVRACCRILELEPSSGIVPQPSR